MQTSITANAAFNNSGSRAGSIGTFAPWYLPPLTVGVTLLLTLSGRTLADSARRRLV